MFFYDPLMSDSEGAGTYKSRMHEAQRARVSAALAEAMDRVGMSNETLYRLLWPYDETMNAEKVSTYRRGTVLLPDYFAQTVAKALGVRDERSSAGIVRHFGYDPLVMIRAYGFFPNDEDHAEIMRRLDQWAAEPTDTDLVRRLLELERLDAEIEEREQELAEVERDRGAVAIARAVTESNKYGVAVWPVLAGPDDDPGRRIHVSDRVDIRRLDGRPLKDQEVWNDLRIVLSRAKALPSIAMPRWPSSVADPLDIDDPHVSMWNVRRLDAPRRPRIKHAHAGFPAIAVSATVSNTWLGYMASMISLVLGYGLTSTTDIARHFQRVPTFNPDTESRNLVHNDLLRHPGEARVWYHAAKVDPRNSASPFDPRDGNLNTHVLHVRLVEDDALLESTARDRLRQPGFLHTDPDAVTAWRKSRDIAQERMPSDEWHLPLAVADVEWGSLAKWEITIDLAIKVLVHLRDMGLTPWKGLADSQASHATQDPAVAGPTFAWMKRRGAPFLG